MKTGKAVALHFAGLYMIENYAVPASTINRYLKDRPWQFESVKTAPSPPAKAEPIVRGVSGTGSPTPNSREVSVTIPLKITVSLGTPEVDGAATITSGEPSTKISTIDEAAHALLRENKTEGVFSVWPGFEIREGRLTDKECLVVSASPDRLAAVRQEMPVTFASYPVEIRPASLNEQMESAGILEAPISSVQYNDDDRTGAGFSFDWIEEEMDVLLHVGPERSWVVLHDFLQKPMAS
jgi:hypothetical protein